jgi:DNA-binding NarL/FixJ family response regulator
MGREGLGPVRADALHSEDGRFAVERGASQPKEATVLVVDRSRVFSDGVAELLQKAGLDAQSLDLNALGDHGRWRQISVLVIDADALPETPARALDQLRAQCPTCQLLIITADPGRRADQVVSATGAVSWLSRQVGPEVLIETVLALIEHRPIGRPPTAQSALPTVSQSASVQLTEREIAVLRLLGRALSNEEMAELLGISPNTVRTHVRNLMIKLNVHSRAGAVAAAHPGLMGGPLPTLEAAASAQ